ncbi:MAG: trigger factor [Flavobacteriales bacterium TMED96]|nr:MAG: trigger factor [Flavobacteriales bacterium TMED96]|tara:strand:- start:2766 stop:4094 length:1329 start_codon:yes stop_codon:yes gene_type:complete
MKIDFKKTDKLNSRISILIEKKDYENKVEKIIKDYKSKINLRGFRKGHVPLSLIKKKYEKAIIVEETNKILSDSLNKYIIDKNLKILGNPIPILEEKFDWDADVFNFKFEIGLSPDLKINFNFKKPAIYHKINVENKIIEERITYLQQQYGELKDEKKISETSELMFEFSSKEENINKKMTLKLSQLKTKKIIDLVRNLHLDETFTFELREFFKDETLLINLSNKPIEEIKKSKINVDAKLLSIQKRINASLEESFFKKIYPNKSIKTSTQFKNEIKKSIESQYDQQSDQKFLDDVTKKLIEEVKFDLPRKFLIKWLQKRDEKEISLENATEQLEKSEKGLRYQLIEEEIINHNNLKVEEKEIKEFAKKIFLRQFGQISKKDNNQEIEQMVERILRNEEETKRIIEQVKTGKLLKFFKENVKFKSKKLSYDSFIKIAYPTTQ